MTGYMLCVREYSTDLPPTAVIPVLSVGQQSTPNTGWDPFQMLLSCLEGYDLYETVPILLLFILCVRYCVGRGIPTQ